MVSEAKRAYDKKRNELLRGSATRKRYKQAAYRKNPGYYRSKYREALEKRRVWYFKLKSAPCTDCHQSYHPAVMQYDHRDPKTKKRAVSLMINDRSSFELIQAEIDKCDLVCANCHHLRSYKRIMERLGKAIDAYL